ncbi:hypothetical protein OH77DRAFT_1505304 [Trametes cingulata]|nr:hypothetical protein OH77DRAFT_1505304 [Trametes cingulata]
MTSHRTDLSCSTLGRFTSAATHFLARSDFMRRDSTVVTDNHPSPPAGCDDTSSPPRAYGPTARYPSKAPEHPPSLSVYERPTATFMWARFTPRVVEPPSTKPVIFVKYRPPQDESDRPCSSSGTSTHSSQGSDASNPTPLSTPASTPPPMSRKRSSSVESDIVASPSDRFLKHPRTSRHSPINRVSSERSTMATTSSEVGRHSSRPLERNLQTTFRSLGMESDSSDSEFMTEENHLTTHHSNSAYATIPPRSAPPAAVNAYAAMQASVNQQVDDPEWMKYTTPHPDVSPSAPFYKCTWTIRTSDGTKECEYQSKKHLVKRHIESKHLQLRPCVCPVCGKGFAQKSNLDTHLNTHTGEEPHKCHYCQLRFKDPARRHRHMISAHGHISSRTKKGRARRATRTPSSPEGSDAGTPGPPRA